MNTPGITENTYREFLAALLAGERQVCRQIVADQLQRSIEIRSVSGKGIAPLAAKRHVHLLVVSQAGSFYIGPAVEEFVTHCLQPLLQTCFQRCLQLCMVRME